MADPIQVFIDELKQNRQSVKAQPLVAVVDDAVAALQAIQGVVTGGSLLRVQSFSSAGGGVVNYTPGPGALSIWARMWGAGGGGGGALTTAGNATLAQAAGSGGYNEGFFQASSLPLVTPLILTFGAPGVAGDITGSNGTAGGDSTFDTLMTVRGGFGGLGDGVGGVTPSAIAGANGGAAGNGGYLQLGGGVGFTSTRFSGTLSIGGRGGIAPGVGFQIGRDAVNTNAGGNGFNMGAGGGAGVAIGNTSRKGGDGAPARCIVFEFG